MRSGDESFAAATAGLILLIVGGSYLLAAWKGEQNGVGRAVLWWTRRAFRLDGRGLALYVLMTGLVCSLAGLAFVLRGVWLSLR